LYWVAPPDSTSPHGAGSGLELRHVFYKGKRVFWQAHVPVINVLYDMGTTYRDWLTEYAGFDVNNILGPHYAEPTKPPVTTCANPGAPDPGKFEGVALEKHPDRLVLTTELQAGWYRYIQKWTFFHDGVIEPRFSFTVSNQNPGMHNKPHNHHAYYRFDFDIDGWPDDVIEYYDSNTKTWHAIAVETNEKHNKQHAKWRVRDKVKNIGYEVIPGPEDFGVPDAWSGADIWAVHYHGNELDDGGSSGGGVNHDAAHMNSLLNSENIDGKDVVLWYRVGRRHVGNAMCHELGPTLRPFGAW
jgi:hypothetical protein